MASEVLVYLDGDFVPWSRATVPVEDRAMQFGDSVYEVIRYYNGEPFRLERHLDRLVRSAEGILLPLPPLDEIRGAITELIDRQGLRDASVYLQVTRGSGPRSHLLPAEPKPYTIAIARPAPIVRPRAPIAAITASDDRWARCYLKTTMLLPNTLARERARRCGADDAIFIRDGFVTEATASNVFIVVDGGLVTPPLSNYILPGITREVVLELARQEGIPCAEVPVPAESLDRADEIMLSGTLSEVTAVVGLDGRPVGSGQPGPVFQKLGAAFDRLIGL